jgi:membrane-bound lytic murein transglycosylase MltF
MIKKLCFLLTLLLLVACNESATSDSAMAISPDEPGPAVEAVPDENAKSNEIAKQPQSRRSLDQIQQELNIPQLSIPWTGDLDGMEERRVIRVLTVYGLGRYYVENAQEKGITYELFKMFEDALNKAQGKKHIRTHVVFIPVARDELIPGLLSGRGDLAAAGLTITPEREDLIDFSEPVSRALSEVLVTGESAPAITTIDDLAGHDMYVRASSSYRSSLDALNRRFRDEGKEEINILDVSEFLEDEDLMEMVNSGALEWAVVDDYKARKWVDVFENLTVREDIVFRTGGRLAWAIPRK